MSNYSMRRFKNKLALWIGALCATLAMIPLVSILYDVVKNGASSLNVDFLTSAPGVIGQAEGGIGPRYSGHTSPSGDYNHHGSAFGSSFRNLPLRIWRQPRRASYQI